MKCIVTREDLEVKGYTVVKSLRDVNIGECECIIFNSSIDDKVNTIILLSQLKEKNIKRMYIAKEIDPMYSSVFNGLEGVIVQETESVSIIKDKEVLDYLVKTYKESNMGTKSMAQEFEALTECLEVVASKTIDNKKALNVIGNKIWRENLQSKLACVDVAIARSAAVDEGVISLLNSVRDMLEDVNRTNEETEYQLNVLQQTLEELKVSNTRNSINFFPTYHATPSLKHVLYVKENSTCAFLRSFLLAYIKYVKMAKRLTFKMLMIMPKLKDVMEKYRYTPKISPESVKLLSVDNSELFITFEPTKAVLDKFFSSNSDGFIVVDSSGGTELITGPTVVKMNAVSSPREVERLRLNTSKVITSMVDIEHKNIAIPFFKDYTMQKNEAAKASLYVLNCKEQYKKIDKLLNLE